MCIDGITNRLAAVNGLARRLLGSTAELEKAIRSCAAELHDRERLAKTTLSNLKELGGLGA